jgi:hypothetical protein
LGHDLDGALTHADRVYNSVQCLAFWGGYGQEDRHTEWSPDNPKAAAQEIVKEIKGLRNKRGPAGYLNTLLDLVASHRPDLPAAPRYAVTDKAGQETIKAGKAPKIVAETERKAPKAKAKAPKAKAKAPTVVTTIK